MRAGLAALLLLGACAHSAGPGPAGVAPADRTRQPLALMELSGLSEEQRQVLESAVCQGLVEGNHGEVSCPDAVRTAGAMLAQRRLAGQDTAEDSLALVHNVEALPQRVRARADEAQAGTFTLELELFRTADGQVLARRSVSAPSFDELVSQSQEAARDLLR